MNELTIIDMDTTVYPGKFTVHGYDTPSGVRTFDTMKEARMAAESLVRNDWSSHVSITQTNTIWQGRKRRDG